METENYVGKLNDFAHIERYELIFKDLGSVGPCHEPKFTQRAVVDGKEYPDGVGKTRKEAKQNAAKNALTCLLGNKQQDPVDSTADEKLNKTEESVQNVSELCDRMRRLSGKSESYKDKQGQTGTNYIGLVAHNCMKKNLCHSYIKVRRCGTASNPQFFYRLLIDKRFYPEAEGKTVKEAKRNAAQLAWFALQEQSDWDSKASVRSTVSIDTAMSVLSPRSTSMDVQESSQSTLMRTSDSELFTISSNLPNVQVPSKSTAPEDDAPTHLSTPTSLESLASSHSMSGTSGSSVFTDSSDSSKDQRAVKDKNMGKIQTSIQSRFISDFEPMDCLGCGAFGSVYKVRHKLLDKCYAVKIVRSEKNCLREPENILFGLDGEVKIGDFGLVTAENDDNDDTGTLMERTGDRGTTTYMAPEQKMLTKQSAAQLAWSALQEQSDWNSKVSVRSTVSEDGSLTESRESSSQSASMSTSDSIVFADSSNPSNGQTPLKSTVPTGLSTPSSPESSASSQSVPRDSSGVCIDSSDSSMDQHAVKDKNMGNLGNQISTWSRFASEFDSTSRLGRGSFGRVYKARNKLLNKYFAVKIVAGEVNYLREVMALSELQNPNVIRYYTSWTEDSGYHLDLSASSDGSFQSAINSSAKYLYIQMELCDTKTLTAWISEKNNQSPQDSKRAEESLHIARQILSGVDYIHSKKHIHRDLKPDNILFGLDGQVKIGDFGLVTMDNASMERTVNKGTPTYRAPEQESEKNYDRKVDIFPLGLIFLELLWKVSSGHERGDVIRKARHQKLPKEFAQTFHRENRIIKSMLCEKPEDRPEASTVKAELERWAQTSNGPKMQWENATF